jgi:nicotinate phosphoribosyltransferase
MIKQDAIIRSILDSDLYKFTMQWFVLQHFPESEVNYTFMNRSKDMTFTKAAVKEIKRQVRLMSKLRLTDEEYDYMKRTMPYLPVTYRQYLAAYRFNPSQVHIRLTSKGELKINISGKWRDTILWEVPLMAIISEVYFKHIDTDWSMEGQEEKAAEKARMLTQAMCPFADFGSRRRRSFETQDLVVRVMSRYDMFVGTSNPYLAMKYNVKCLGTCAHEAIGAVAATDSLNHPNAAFMDRWEDTYEGALGTMLPDTYGLDSFLKDFSLKRSKLWDGCRHDSGSPFEFTDKLIKHYSDHGIDPTTKTLIFSDGLDVDRSIEIANYCRGRIRFSFGIGTFFTSDFTKVSDPTKKSKAMNMVIKLTMIDGVHVVKLSDNPAKAIGDKKMVKIMRYIHFNN